ncbi:MAG: D-2-hydroxyacid dehydrogenase [Sphaerochaetaceae bacterium]
MQGKKEALVYVQYPELYQQSLLKLFQEFGYSVMQVIPDNAPSSIDKALEALSHVEVAILGSALPKKFLEDAPNLQWIHFDWVGVEGMLTKAMFANNRRITNGSGRNSLCLAEHVFYFIFTLSYGTREIFASQDSHKWGVIHQNPYTSLYGKTILIIGTGSIGQEVAERAKVFGMRTLGYARNTEKNNTFFDSRASIQNGDNLLDLVSSADYVVLAVSLNNDTFHMINEDIFSKMKETAYVINISRGAVIDEKALLHALENKTIAGAGCDTFETEPLPETSGLWDMKNIVITPHSTPQSPLKFNQGLSIIRENLQRIETGEMLINQQSIHDVFM